MSLIGRRSFSDLLKERNERSARSDAHAAKITAALAAVQKIGAGETGAELFARRTKGRRP